MFGKKTIVVKNEKVEFPKKVATCVRGGDCSSCGANRCKKNTQYRGW